MARSRAGLRHQLASYSPISAAGLLRAAPLPGRSTGDARAQAQALLQSRLGVASVTLVGSGTEALVATLDVAARLHGAGVHAVALPAFGCFDLAAAVVRHGRPLAFYDLDPATLGPDPASLARVIADGARTVVIASLYGVPIDWTLLDPLLADVIVIEDAAQGHGARWHGAPLGTHGRLGLLSFSRGKGWTGGAGGAVLVRDPQDTVALEALSLTDVSARDELAVWLRATAQWSLGRPAWYGLPRAIPALGLGETRYHAVPAPSVMTTTAARLLAAMTADADREAEARRARAAAFHAALAHRDDLVLVAPRAHSVSGAVRFPVLTASGLAGLRDPDAAVRLGVAPSYPSILPRLPELAALARLPRRIEPSWSGAQALASRLVTLPTHSRLTDAEYAAILALL